MAFNQLSNHDQPGAMGDLPRDNTTVELALGLATEAMKSAAVAMSKATEALTQSKSKPLIPQTIGPTSSTPSTSRPLSEDEEGTSPSGSPPTSFPPRSSSIPRKPQSFLPSPNPQSRKPFRIITTSSPISKLSASFIPPTQTPTFQKALLPPALPPATKTNSLCHIDLIDAASALNPPYQELPLSSYPENSTIPLVLSNNSKTHTKPNYEEAVADRNINGFWPLTFTYPLSTSRSPSRISSTLDSAILISHTTTITSATAKPPLPFRTKAHEIAFILSMVCSNLLTQAALAQSIAPMPLIGISFHDTNEMNWSWYAAAYCLTIGAFILPGGRLGGVYGHKKVYVGGWIWFGVFSALAGFSLMVQSALNQRPNLDQNPNSTTMLEAETFFWARAMQGIGPALLLPNALALLTDVYRHAPNNKRNIIYAMFGATAPTGLVLGGVFSGLIAEMVGWPSAFWVMGGVCFLMAALSFVVIKSNGRMVDRGSRLGYDVEVEVENDEKIGWVERWMELDGNGAFLGMAGLVLFGFAWNQAPLVGWQTPYTYFILIIAVVLLIAFLINESLAPHPLLPIPYLTSSTLTPLLCTFLAWSSFSIYLFYTYSFLFLQSMPPPSPPPFTTSPAPSPSTSMSSPPATPPPSHQASFPPAVLFVPVALSGILAVASTSLSFAKFGPKLLLFLSLLFFAASNLIMALVRIDENYWKQIFVGMVLLPWGMDMSFPSAVVLVGEGMGRSGRLKNGSGGGGSFRGRRDGEGVGGRRINGKGTEPSTLVMGAIMVGIAVGLGVAGTVEREVGLRVGNESEADIVLVFRSVFWLGVGLSGLGCLIAGISFVEGQVKEKRKDRGGMKMEMS